METNIYLLRHAQSLGNVASLARDRVDGYASLKAYVQDAFKDADIERKIRTGAWPSPEMIRIAHATRAVIEKKTDDISDSDYDLSPAGDAQARKLGRDLHEHLAKIDVIFCSPYVRAVRTKDLLLETCPALRQAKHHIKHRLVEKSMGEIRRDFMSYFILKPSEFIRAKNAGHYYYDYQPPEGESSRQVIARVNLFVEELLTGWQGQTILIVAHKVTIMAIMAIFEHKTARDQYLTIDTVENAIHNGALVSYFQNNGCFHRR